MYYDELGDITNEQWEYLLTRLINKENKMEPNENQTEPEVTEEVVDMDAVVKEQLENDSNTTDGISERNDEQKVVE